MYTDVQYFFTQKEERTKLVLTQSLAGLLQVHFPTSLVERGGGDDICKSTKQCKSKCWLIFSTIVRLTGFRGAVSGKWASAPWGHLYKIHIVPPATYIGNFPFKSYKMDRNKNLRFSVSQDAPDVRQLYI